MASGRVGFLAVLVLVLGGCVAPSVGAREQAARNSSRQGRAAFAVADYKTAVAHYSQSLRHHQNTGDHLETCLDLLNLAVVYRAMGRPAASAECTSAFTIASTHPDNRFLSAAQRRRLRSMQAEAAWFQAVLALDRGQDEQAGHFLEEARAFNSVQLRIRIRALEQRLGSNAPDT